MIIRTVVVTPFEQNARIIADEATGEACIVDPGGDVQQILAAVPRMGGNGAPYRVTKILLTHAHLDHAGGVAAILRALESQQGERPLLLGHRSEAQMRQSIAAQSLMFGVPAGYFENCPEPDVFVEEGDAVSVCGMELYALFTPGHSPGHLSFYIPQLEAEAEVLRRGGGTGRKEKLSGPLLLAGDALFNGSIGRTDLPGGNHAQLLQSIREKLLPLPGETRVLSGHGDDTTIEREKLTNPFLR